MKNLTIYSVLGIFLFLSIGAVVISKNKVSAPGQTACTLEAKLCPDGSAVGRTGPNCEFAACPDTQTPPVPDPQPEPVSKEQGILSGRVTLGPTCPVERTPPDPACAPKGYATNISIRKEDHIGQIEGNTFFVKTISSDSDGNFKTTLPAGAYILDVKNEGRFPLCQEAEANVTAGKTVRTEISCDTGIR